MSFKFEWNAFADQPHNVAPRLERFRHHLKHVDTYLTLFTSNLHLALPVLKLYLRNLKKMYGQPVQLENAFALSVSPHEERNQEVIENLKEAGVRHSLVRIPSWEAGKLDYYGKFLELLHKNGIDFVIALLQRREDVTFSSSWKTFVEAVFSRFNKICSFYEVGHAWNRTKWGVWDYKEYLQLALPSLNLAQKYAVKLVGPAVIDFEFHLYPPTLDILAFDKVSSLLYVDRQGAPENSQFGMTTARKVSLLRAIVDSSGLRGRDLWVTEVNWPLKGTGKYSPASGKPNISEEEQANYLVRYFVICLASGHIQRIYWWQLVAPGYGLIDSRNLPWRKRPSFSAFKTMVKLLDKSLFVSKIKDKKAEIFLFNKEEESFALCWTKGPAFDLSFERPVKKVLNRDGEEISFHPQKITIEENPKYVFFS